VEKVWEGKLPCPMPVMNRPIHSGNILDDKAIQIHPMTSGTLVAWTTNLRPKISTRIPASSAPMGVEITPTAAEKEEKDSGRVILLGPALRCSI